MTDIPPFPIPERISSLMPLSRRQALRHHQERSVSVASKISQICQTSVDSTTTDFLEAKIAALEDEKAYLCCIREGLDDAKLAGLFTNASFQGQIGPCLTRFRSTASVLHILKRQRKMLEEDLEEEVALKRQRLCDPPDEGLLERAYRDTIIPRVMGASAKQGARPFKQSQFKVAVNEHYDIATKCQKGTSYCHVLGLFLPASTVKAAHLVPKSMTQEELAPLFGGEHDVLADPRNGKEIPSSWLKLANEFYFYKALSLASPIEALLDLGVIAVVPIPGVMTTPTIWRCVVLDESKNQNIVHVREEGEIVRVNVSFTNKLLIQRILLTI
ncbi:hypothetical protein N7474_003463 [Penicillium riverlandense]|uniref:uncharacterized protein n=1 Tax=Penicillium riverlandense TaxID=1903569 RepID=UPI002548306D|nr:uncharacterized protein N7474_003463 [Penicillium riverlandense]KAJ5826325.1 hypothetical protein N7474_003463 [Penicillium riverlandense]